MIEDAVRAILTANPAVLAGARGGIRTPPMPQLADPATQLPAITLQRISGGETLTQDGPGGSSIRMQVDVWAESYREARELARMVQTALNGFPRAAQCGWQSGEAIQLVMLIDGSQACEYDSDVRQHRATADYRVETAAEAVA